MAFSSHIPEVFFAKPKPRHGLSANFDGGGRAFWRDSRDARASQALARISDRACRLSARGWIRGERPRLVPLFPLKTGDFLLCQMSMQFLGFALRVRTVQFETNQGAVSYDQL